MNKVRVIHNATRTECWKPGKVRGEECRSIMQEDRGKGGRPSVRKVEGRERRMHTKCFEKFLFK